MFFWTEEKLSLYKRAAEYTAFNDDIGRIVLDRIGPDREIWDLGCGLSYLSFYLSDQASKIDCVDSCKYAIAALKKSLDERDLYNIELHREDYRSFLDRKGEGDCIILSHFLRLEDRLDYILDRSKTLVIIRNSQTRRKKGLFPGKKETIEDVEELLLSRGIDYEKIIYNGDFGQPLRSLEEACRYYSSYRRESIEEEEVLRFLDRQEDKEYPYYFPKDKSIGIIVVDRR